VGADVAPTEAGRYDELDAEGLWRGCIAGSGRTWRGLLICLEGIGTLLFVAKGMGSIVAPAAWRDTGGDRLIIALLQGDRLGRLLRALIAVLRGLLGVIDRVDLSLRTLGRGDLWLAPVAWRDHCRYWRGLVVRSLHRSRRSTLSVQRTTHIGLKTLEILEVTTTYVE
jgi:hypothetical protein